MADSFLIVNDDSENVSSEASAVEICFVYTGDLTTLYTPQSLHLLLYSSPQVQLLMPGHVENLLRRLFPSLSLWSSSSIAGALDNDSLGHSCLC